MCEMFRFLWSSRETVPTLATIKISSIITSFISAYLFLIGALYQSLNGVNFLSEPFPKPEHTVVQYLSMQPQLESK